MLRFDEKNQGHTIQVNRGQEVEIRLQENPTTGYQWHILQTGSPVSEFLLEAFDPGRKAPGQAGVHSWRFKIVAEGTTSIELVSRRSWDATASPGRSYTLYLNCEKPRATEPAAT